MNVSEKGMIMESLKNNLINSPAILSSLSHEMRTYMNAIMSFSFLMKENSYSNSEREEFSNHIYSSCEQILQLFDSFLDTAKIDTEGSSPELRLCKLSDILDDLFKEFSDVIRKDGDNGLELLKDIPADDSIKVLIDKNIIFRIITSLFHNSIKNTNSGYIKIGLFRCGNEVTFSVLDTGNDYDKFKEFLETKDINESLALHDDIYSAINITLAMKLTKLLGGTIWIEHNGTGGSGMYFSVPVKFIADSPTTINDHVYSSILI
jgi:K+-sensing histidine kinase KdpD